MPSVDDVIKLYFAVRFSIRKMQWIGLIQKNKLNEKCKKKSLDAPYVPFVLSISTLQESWNILLQINLCKFTVFFIKPFEIISKYLGVRRSCFDWVHKTCSLIWAAVYVPMLFSSQCLCEVLLTCDTHGYSVVSPSLLSVIGSHSFSWPQSLQGPRVFISLWFSE